MSFNKFLLSFNASAIISMKVLSVQIVATFYAATHQITSLKWRFFWCIKLLVRMRMCVALGAIRVSISTWFNSRHFVWYFYHHPHACVCLCARLLCVFSSVQFRIARNTTNTSNSFKTIFINFVVSNMHDKSEIWSVHPLRVQTSLAVKCFCLHTFAEHVCVVCIIMFWHNIPNQVWPCKNNQNTFVQHIVSSCSRMQTDFGAILHFATVFVSEPKKNTIWIWFKRAHSLSQRKKCSILKVNAHAETFEHKLNYNDGI